MFVIPIKFLFCYKSSFCSPILKLSIFKYLFVTKVQFVHPYQNLHFWNINQILFCYIKFILFILNEAFNFQIFICYKSSICSPISKLFWYNGRISILLKKFNFFTQIRASNFQIFICYKSSICSMVSKLAFL